VFSREPLWEIDDAGDAHDLLWSRSLLTHFDVDYWTPTLRWMRDRVRPGGLLLFTTHGQRTIDYLLGLPGGEPLARIRKRRAPGYGFGDQAIELGEKSQAGGFAYTAFPEHPTDPYGMAFAQPVWVRETVAAATPDLELVSHQPHAWYGHQDVWAFRRR
jgi:hypothetical protein